jgi:ethanolamine utilization cobalamin adenosyltransferase
MNLCEIRDQQIRHHLQLKQSKITTSEKEILESKEMQMMMEDKIYMLSIDNKSRQDDKDQLIMLMPLIYKALKG